MSGQRTTAAESVLQNSCPQASVRAIGCQRRQGHSQIARRHHIELAAQPARRATVIGDGHHGGNVGCQPAGRRQRRIQAVSAAQRDDAIGHSRPRSRCSARTDSC